MKKLVENFSIIGRIFIFQNWLRSCFIAGEPGLLTGCDKPAFLCLHHWEHWPPAGAFIHRSYSVSILSGTQVISPTDLVKVLMQTSYIHKLTKNSIINAGPQKLFLKASSCDLFTSHFLKPKVFHSLIATIITYIDHLLRHISKKVSPQKN